MDALWKLVLKNVQINLDDEIVYDSQHDYVDLVDDLGYDSISLICLIIDIEKNYNIEIDERYLTIEKLKNYGFLNKVILLKGEYHE